MNTADVKLFRNSKEIFFFHFYRVLFFPTILFASMACKKCTISKLATRNLRTICQLNMILIKDHPL